MSATNVDTVCTDQDLADEVLGLDRLEKLKPDDWSTFKPARQQVFDRVLKRLQQRTPPVMEADLHDVTELRDAVVYGVIALASRANMHTADSDNVHAANATHYHSRYMSEVATLMPTVSESQRAAPGGITFHRR